MSVLHNVVIFFFLIQWHLSIPSDTINVFLIELPFSFNKKIKDTKYLVGLIFTSNFIEQGYSNQLLLTKNMTGDHFVVFGWKKERKTQGRTELNEIILSHLDKYCAPKDKITQVINNYQEGRRRNQVINKIIDEFKKNDPNYQFYEHVDQN